MFKIITTKTKSQQIKTEHGMEIDLNLSLK